MDDIVPSARPRRRADGLFAALIAVLAVATIASLTRAGDALRATAPPRSATVITSAPARASVTITAARLRLFPMPNAGANVMQPAIGPDGRVWFGEMGANQLAVLDPTTGAVNAWVPPHGQYGIMDVAVARDGMVWFTEQASNYIGRFDPRTATFTTFPLNGPKGRPAAPQDIAIDSGGGVWFTEVSAGAVGRLDPASGSVRTFPLPTDGSAPAYPFGLALDAHGGVWYTELTGGTLGRLDPHTGAVQRYRTPTRNAQLFAVAVDPTGRVWFTELQYGRLGMLDSTTGSISEIPLPTPHSTALNLYGIAATGDGTIWVASMGQNAMVRYDPAKNAFSMLALPDDSSIPYGVALDTSGHVWFTADRTPTNYVARIEG